MFKTIGRQRKEESKRMEERRQSNIEYVGLGV